MSRRRFGVFVVNFEHISHLFLVFLLLALSMYLFAGSHITHSGRYIKILFIAKIYFENNDQW